MDFISLITNSPLLPRILISVIIIAVSYYLSIVLSNYVMKLRLKAPPEVIFNITRVIKMSLLALGFLIVLPILGIELSGLLVAVGFTGIVVGLAAQQVLSQFFSGISLLLEGRARVGDSIRIGDDWGVIESIGLMSTQIRLWSGEILTIPNNDLMSSKIYNFSRSVARRVDISIPISYTSNISKALEVIRSLLDSKELVLAEPQPVLIVDSLGDSAIIIKALFWVPSQEFWTIRREIIKEVKESLEAVGIEIPYPQRVVWLKELSK